MRRTRTALPAALAIGVLAALPVAGHANGVGKEPGSKRAHAAGGDAPPVIPSIVRVRVNRGEKALDRAGDYIDRDMPTKAVASLLNARRNMYAAWRGARYVIEHAPPPPPEDARVHGKAHASDDPTGPVYAQPPETAVAVLGFQHDVATAAYGFLDGAKGALRDSVSTTIFAALDRRDGAIDYISKLPPPGEDAGEDAVTFDVLMPNIPLDLDDEVQQIDGLLDGGALTPGEKRILKLAESQVLKTENTVNTFWPPVTED